MLLAPIDTDAEGRLSAAGSAVHGMFTLFIFRRILSGEGEIPGPLRTAAGKESVEKRNGLGYSDTMLNPDTIHRHKNMKR